MSWLKQIFNFHIPKLFSWSKFKSPSVKNKKGNIQTNVGDNSLQQMAGRDINNNFLHEKNAIKDDEDWQNLIGLFTEQRVKYIIDSVNNPLLKNLDATIDLSKRYIVEAFKKINITEKDQRAPILVKLKSEIILAIEIYCKSKDEAVFKEKWWFVKEQLISLCKKNK